jgi:hypothetical protein
VQHGGLRQSRESGRASGAAQGEESGVKHAQCFIFFLEENAV